MLRSTTSSRFSTFAVNMETARPPTGTPRGFINRVTSLGLPPYAAWTRNLDAKAMYRMSPAHTWGQYLPKEEQRMENIWLNERVRIKVKSAGDQQYIQKILKYPYTRTGVWFSDALDHWIQVPHVRGAQFEIEKDGGMDNFILKRSGQELRSTYGERLRRNILGRQREIEKNFLLQKTAERLAAKIMKEIREEVPLSGKNQQQQPLSDEDGEKVEEIFRKYGLSKREIANQADQLRAGLSSSSSSSTSKV